MKQFFWGVTWQAWQNRWLILVVALAVYFLVHRLRRVYKSVDALSHSRYRYVVLPQYASWRYNVKMILLFVAVFFLFLSLLRPQWNKKEQLVKQEGRDLMIALDISRSMLARDCEPDRLGCAKRKIKKLLQLLPADRVGLLLFSGATSIHCPLTADHSAFLLFLDQVDVETISSGTTALDKALKEAIKSFKAISDRKNKLLVVFTDGEDFSRDLSGIKQEAIDLGMHIFAVGVGSSEGAPIPLFDEDAKPAGHQRDKKGNVVISRLNESLLTTLANDSGGTYVRAQADDGEVKRLVKLVERYEKEKIDDKKISELQEQYPFFLAVSFVALLVEWLL